MIFTSFSEMTIYSKAELLKDLQEKLKLFPFDKQAELAIKNSLDLKKITTLTVEEWNEGEQVVTHLDLERSLESAIRRASGTIISLIEKKPVRDLDEVYSYIEYVLRDFNEEYNSEE